jgi:hypothetical protein
MKNLYSKNDIPAWMPWVLRIAALYNLLYALLLTIWPSQAFEWLQMPVTPEVMIRCIGMMVGIYALGYWIAAQDVLRYWPLVAVGIVGKTLGPLGFLQAALSGALPWHSGIMLLFNDLIWWLPFWIIVVHCLRVSKKREGARV